jgi:hypothetical protein
MGVWFSYRMRKKKLPFFLPFGLVLKNHCDSRFVPQCVGCNWITVQQQAPFARAAGTPTVSLHLFRIVLSRQTTAKALWVAFRSLQKHRACCADQRITAACSEAARRCEQSYPRYLASFKRKKEEDQASTFSPGCCCSVQIAAIACIHTNPYSRTGAAARSNKERLNCKICLGAQGSGAIAHSAIASARKSRVKYP